MLPESPGPQHCVDRRQLLHGALAAALPVLALPASAAAAKPLVVGGLAVTCNLTLPVACVARAALLTGAAEAYIAGAAGAATAGW